VKDIVLKVEDVSKQYRLGLLGTGTISHDLNRWWHLARGKEDPYLQIGDTNDRSSKEKSEYVWALKDINFEVERGEVLGIIGKNGAGKSTLLKILSKVTAPTTGKVTMKGRVASLLEVGTGFHPELTGKENIFLNGAILGMKTDEIKQKFDEIVDFSGCEKYIDTPAKRYSSGMKVRLAFAVAAFLEPEILIVDEVLAVGDAEFQKKAIGKMQEVSKGEGRTVLFVSHNMAAVKSLCSKALVLNNGFVAFEGDVDRSINFYLKMNNENGSESLRFFDKTDFPDRCGYQIFSAGVKAKGKNFNDPITRDDFVVFEIEFFNSLEIFGISLRFKDEQGNFIFVLGEGNLKSTVENQKIYLEIPGNFFNEGDFFVDIQVTDLKSLLLRKEDCVSFSIIQEKRDFGVWMGKTEGPLKPNFNWSICT
jgi:lipopolysaccharide transport system ATP-binding protein